MRRTNNYKICQWDVLDPNEIATLALKNSAAAGISVSPATPQANDVQVPRPRPSFDTETGYPTRQSVPEGRTRPPDVSPEPYPEPQTVAVGPWTISASHKADDLDGCAMSRSSEGMDITFFHSRDSCAAASSITKMRSRTRQAYTVRLAAGPRAVEAKALAKSTTVRIALTDPFLLKNLRAADAFEVREKELRYEYRWTEVQRRLRGWTHVWTGTIE